MTVKTKTTPTIKAKATLTAFMYIRVSTPSQEVEEQVKMIRQHAADHGIEIIGQYGDYQKRHKSDQRRSFQAMLTDMETHRPDLILVQRLDRFGTADSNELGYFITLLKKEGVRLITVIDGKDRSKGDLETTLMNAVAGGTRSTRRRRRRGSRIRDRGSLSRILPFENLKNSKPIRSPAGESEVSRPATKPSIPRDDDTPEIQRNPNAAAPRSLRERLGLFGLRRRSFDSNGSEQIHRDRDALVVVVAGAVDLLPPLGRIDRPMSLGNGSRARSPGIPR